MERKRILQVVLGISILFGIVFAVSKIVFATSYNKLYAFDYTNGAQSSGFLTRASDGNLYGLTSSGGASGFGVLFKFNPTTNIQTKLFDFDGTNGANPYGSLVQANDDYLYGMTYQGGANNRGVIFRVDIASGILTKLYDFTAVGGGNPFGALIQASDGLLYGATYTGGANDLGVIFSFNPTGSVYTKLYTFTNLTGANPHGTLLQAANGSMYGLTPFGGANGAGVVFKFDPLTNTYTDIYDFDGGLNGGGSYGTFMQATNGKLYGMTRDGGANNLGILFTITTSNDSFEKLYDFTAVGGGGPYGTLVQANDGYLYGNMYSGGATNNGVVFRFDTTTNTYTKLVDLDYSIGRRPYEALTQGADGILYGMTFDGGGAYGVIYSYNPIPRAPDAIQNPPTLGTLTDNVSVSISWSAPPDDNGSPVTGYKIERKAASESSFSTIVNSIPGTSYIDTTARPFIIYSYRVSAINAIGVSNPSSEAKILIGSYSARVSLVGGTTGSGPSSALVSASDGLLYGLSTSGGANGYGAIIRFNPETNATTPVYAFTADEAAPIGSLVAGAGSALYGVTSSGGLNSYGTIFKYDTATNTFTKLYDFDSVNGSNPYGPMIFANNLLYGVTMNGGTDNYGTIFKFNPTTTTYTKLYDFSLDTGTGPQGTPVIVAGHLLYGSASSGGDSGNGALYSFDLDTNSYVDLHDFQGTDGQYPIGALVDGADGYLYGQASGGGANNNGAIFRFNPTNNTFSKLYDFTLEDGSAGGSFIKGTDGALYAPTNGGGINGFGTIFRFSPSDSGFVKIHDFDGTHGSYPANTLFKGAGGSLYGLTISGGDTDAGVVFEILPYDNQPSVGITTAGGGGYLLYLLNHPQPEIAPQPTSLPSAPKKTPITQTLIRGSRGSQVVLLQTILKDLGMYVSSVDGRFGNKTYASVRLFQKANKLRIDGIVGPYTRALLNTH